MGSLDAFADEMHFNAHDPSAACQHLATTMSITDGIRKNVNLQHPQFFVSHTEKLSALLLVVSAEASVMSDPEALCDYLELTEILASLLEEAQLCSILSADDIRAREHQVLSFLDKIQTVQEAVADWVRIRT